MNLTGVYGSLGTITTGQFQAAAERLGIGRVTAARPLTTGLFGKNVALTTTEGEWVLRAAPWPPDSASQYRRERFFARAIHERTTLTAPWPYLIDPSPDILGTPYAVMRRLPGEVARWDDDHEWAALGAAMGRAAAALHAVTFPHVGEWDPDADDVVAFGGTPAEWFQARYEWWLDRTAQTSEPLDHVSESFLREAIDASLPFCRGVEATYVHHDLKIDNVTTRRHAGGYEVIGVFDLGEGFAGDPDEDLARSLWQLSAQGPQGPRAMHAAYREAYRARAGERERLRAYVICDLLIIWEYGRRERMPWFGTAETFRAFAEPLWRSVERAIT